MPALRRSSSPARPPAAGPPGRLPRLRTALRWTARIVLAVMLVSVIAVAGVSAWAFHQAGIKIREIPALTNPERAPLPQPVKVFSADGILLGQVGNEKRVVLSPRQIPDLMRHATIAIEDQRFYQHRGVDAQALARAAWVDLKSGSAAQGASTITMQYVRNVYLNFEKTTHRKLQEVALALQLESVWTKERILTAYLNTVYYGDGAYGVEAAARQYFGRSARDLTLAQAAMIAGLAQNPNELNPRLNPDGARARQAQVLDEMYAQGYATREQVVRAKATPVKLRKKRKAELPAEPQLLQLAVDELNRTLDPVARARGGLQVRTSLHLAHIRKARASLRSAYGGAHNAPVVAASFLDPRTGRVQVVAHSKRGGFFNYATQSRRQPGSVVKAFTAAQLLREGGQLADPVDNSTVTARNGSQSYRVQPTRSDVRTVADALRFSQNPAFWRLYQKAGPKAVLELERRLGVRGMDSNPAASLGGVRTGTNTLEIAGAFGAFANDGRFVRPHVITEIKDLLGNTVYTDQPKARAVLEAEYARQLTVGLRDVVDRGFPQLKQSLPVSRFRPLAGKTGTSENNGDAWFAGYTPQLAGAVWTGYAKSRRSLRDTAGAEVFGSTVPARAFSDIAADLLRGQPVLKFPKPAGVQRIPRLEGLSLAKARAALMQFQFSGAYFVPKFDPDYRTEKVLQVTPEQGAWVKPSTPIKITYSVNQRPAPNLVGKTYLDALDELGTFAKVRAKLTESDEPTGTVIEQSPYAGEVLKAGGVMEVTVATKRAPPRTIIRKEPYVPTDSELARLRRELEAARAQADQQPATVTRTVVPDVVGLPVAQAEQVLRSVGLTAVSRGSGEMVTGQAPTAGNALSDGQSVQLTLGS